MIVQGRCFCYEAIGVSFLLYDAADDFLCGGLWIITEGQCV